MERGAAVAIMEAVLACGLRRDRANAVGTKVCGAVVREQGGKLVIYSGIREDMGGPGFSFG